MNITHEHPLYKTRRSKQGNGKYNGAYYYSKDIVKYIIPNVKTDRKWVTVRLEDCTENLDHSIVFIHNNRNPNYYEYLRKYKDVVCVCSQPHTYENMKFFGNPVLLPLSLDVKSVEKYKLKTHDKDTAFAGRRLKLNNHVPNKADILTDMSQTELIKAMAHYKEIYAVGRTAIQAKILGCKVLPYDNMYPDPRIWKIVDCTEAVKMLQRILNEIDGENNA